MPTGRESRVFFTADAPVFATTHWSVVVAAGESDSSKGTEAMAQLCRTYWYPLYAYVRRKGYDSHEAQDLTQEFFSRLLTRNYLNILGQTGIESMTNVTKNLWRN